jgi:hypothetical protein
MLISKLSVDEWILKEMSSGTIYGQIQKIAIPNKLNVFGEQANQ